MPWLSPCLNVHSQNPAVRRSQRPTREEAEAAVQVLLRWTGDDPSREGLRDTPKRVVKAFEEFFSGYREDAASVLSRVFEEVHGYDDVVLVRDIPFSSHCEHHMVPFFGMAHVAYYPSESGVVGLSKLARLVDVFAKRLQTQEALTAQIIGAIDRHIAPARLRRHDRGAASVHVHARHSQTRRGDRHDAIHRCLSRRSSRTSPVPDPAARRQITAARPNNSFP